MHFWQCENELCTIMKVSSFNIFTSLLCTDTAYSWYVLLRQSSYIGTAKSMVLDTLAAVIPAFNMHLLFCNKIGSILNPLAEKRFEDTQKNVKFKFTKREKKVFWPRYTAQNINGSKQPILCSLIFCTFCITQKI